VVILKIRLFSLKKEKKVKKILKRLEDWLLAYLLKRVKSPMSYAVFSAVAEKFVLSSVHLIVWRKKGHEIQVLLTQRDSSDPNWANLWHIPGTIIRRSDDFGNPIGSGDPIKRLEQTEILTKLSSAPKLLFSRRISDVRGDEITYVYSGMISENVPPCGKFFDVDRLPLMVNSNRILISEVVQLIR
jgi:hypothetical protein